MESMTLDFRAFAFIITLAAVVNGLGIVRWLTTCAEYLRHRQSLVVEHYWVFTAAAAFHFLLHILLWWSLWSVRDARALNCVTYLYLLSGPVLLYLGTSLLVPETDDNSINVRTHYFSARTTYCTVLALVWVWALFISPVLRGYFAPTTPVILAFFVIAVVQRMTRNPLVHSIAAAANWLLLAVFIGLYQMQLGGSLQAGG
jgi:hypothetical protein